MDRKNLPTRVQFLFIISFYFSSFKMRASKSFHGGIGYFMTNSKLTTTDLCHSILKTTAAASGSAPILNSVDLV